MPGRFAFSDFEPATQDMRSEVMAGLQATPKQLSPKYFYDAKGSALFEAITDLPEYYLTRTEMALFDAHLPEISTALGDEVCLIEYGSGSSKKIRKLLTSIAPTAYVPIDISQEHLLENARALHADFPALDVFPICADITQPFQLPAATESMLRVGFYPGSSIGNFVPAQARSFLTLIRETVGHGGALIIGVDRKKDSAMLERAYDDAAGVTAAFNLNALTHLNERLNANFDVQQFAHEARYNEDEGCVQMFLRSLVTQQVDIDGQFISFAENERLHTENSYKYDVAGFTQLAQTAGFEVERTWSDADALFTLYLLRGA